MPEQTQRQLPLRRAETAAAFILAAQAVAGGLALVLARLSRSAAGEAEAWLLVAGLIVWVAVFIHQRLRRLAIEESFAAESLRTETQGQPGAALFEAEAADLLSARNRLAQFEKYFLPGFSVVMILVLGLVSFGLLRGVASAPAEMAMAEPLRNFWAFAGIAFVSFLLAKYAAGLATQPPWRPLQPGASYLMACALGSLLVAIAFFVLSVSEVQMAERVVAWAIPVLMAVLALETLLLLVMGIYRPRVAGDEARPAHDSRLLSMLTTSRGLLHTTAETLDYQFGFKVSETWFYRFMEGAIGPLILFQAATLWLLTCVVVVDTHQQAIVEHFGVPRAGHEALGPGIHLKLPWPIEIVYTYPTARVERLVIGEQLVEDAPGFLWTKSHAKQPFTLLAANRRDEATAPPAKAPADPGAAPKPKADRAAPGVSLITGTVNVYYHVADLHDFLYSNEDPKRTLEALCYRELTRYTANSDFMEFLGTRRREAVASLTRAIQSAATERKLGIKIVDVSLQGLHPPVDVAGSFEEVVGALEEKEAKVWQARGHANSVLPAARAGAAMTLATARIYATDREVVGPAVEKEFLMQLDAYREAPSVFKHRKLLSAVQDAFATARKIIRPVWASVHDVLSINLDERTTSGVGLSTDLGGQ